MKNDKTVTWFHLSDYHLNNEAYSTKRKAITKELLNDIQNQFKSQKDLNNIDFILLTGDLTYHGNFEEFELVYKEFISPLIKILNIKNNQVFIVPGNHEVYRNDETNLRVKIQEKLPINHFTALIEKLKNNKPDLNSIFNPFKNYNDFIKKYFPHILSDHGFYKYPLKLNEKITIEITGINTAWIAKGGNEEKGKLSAGYPFISNSIDIENNSIFRLTLMHHPMKWMYQFGDDTKLFEEFLKNQDMVFYGHLHETNFDPFLLVDTIYNPAGAAFNNDILERFWYSFGSFNIEEKHVKIHGREYRKEGKREKFYNMPWSPFQRSINQGKRLYNNDKKIERIDSMFDNAVQNDLGTIPNIIEELGIPYVEITEVTEKKYGILKGILILHGVSRYTTFQNIIFSTNDKISKNLATASLLNSSQKKIDNLIQGGPLLLFSGRQQDIIRTASESLLSLISQSLLITLVSKMRGENKEDIENEFLGLEKRGVFKIENEYFPFTGEQVISISLEEAIEKEISKPENFSEKDKNNIIEVALELLENHDLDYLEKAWLLILLNSQRKKINSSNYEKLKDIVINQIESSHPIYLLIALNLITNKKLLLKYAQLSVTHNNIIRTREKYADTLLAYGDICKKEKYIDDAQRCIKKAIEVLEQELKEEKNTITSANLFIKVGEIYEKNLGDNINASIQYSKGINILSEKIEKIQDDKEKSKIFESIGNIQLVKLHDYQNAIKNYKKGLQLEDRWQIWGGIASAIEEQAKKKESQGEISTHLWRLVVKNHLNAIERIEKPEIQAQAWIEVGDIRKDKLKTKKNWKEAYLKSIECLEHYLNNTVDVSDKSKTFEYIGDIQLVKLHNYQNALKNYNKGLQLEDRWQIWRGIASAIEEQAKKKESQGEISTHLWRLVVKNHLNAIERIEKPEIQAQAWIKIGDIRKEKLKTKKNWKVAYLESIKCLESYLVIVEDKTEKSKIFENIGDIQFEKLHDYKNAIRNYNKGLEIADRWQIWRGIAFVVEEQTKEKESQGLICTQEWKLVVKNHLNAIERIEETEIKAQAWEKVGDIKKDKLNDEKGSKKAYNKSIIFFKSALEITNNEGDKTYILKTIDDIRKKCRQEK